MMALSWTATIGQLDSKHVFAPERYSAKRLAHADASDTVPLTDVARLTRYTLNPAGKKYAENEYLVLDTTHAVEGKILFNGTTLKGHEVGSAKRPVSAGNVIVSRLRTYLRQIALVDEALLERYGVEAVCSTEFYVLEPIEPGDDIAFLVPYLLCKSVQQIFIHSQEGGHHPRMHESVLASLRVPRELLQRRRHFSNQVRQFVGSIREGEKIFQNCRKQIEALD